jgi:hypothetical protein
MSGAGKPKRTVRGRRPQFHDDAAIDKLHGMIMAMATEMSVLYERLDTMERVAAGKGVMLQTELENYTPDAEAAGAREAWRQKFLERLFYLYREEVDDRLSKDSDASYAAFLKEIS